jgi:Carbohydrate phosphorylase
LGLDDFISYIEQELADEAFENQDEWIDKSITSVARMGFFPSDRVITEYKVSRMWSSYRSGKGGISEDENSNRNLRFFLRVKAFEHTSNDISVKQMHFLVSVIPDSTVNQPCPLQLTSPNVHLQYLHLSINCTIRCIHC